MSEREGGTKMRGEEYCAGGRGIGGENEGEGKGM